MEERNFLSRGDGGVVDRGPRHLPVLKAHPLWRRPGKMWLKVYRCYRAAFRCPWRAYQDARMQFQSTQSVCFFGGTSRGGMLGLLATWRCLLLDIVQTGVTSWLCSSQSAFVALPMSHHHFFGEKIVDQHTPLSWARRVYHSTWVAGPRSGLASPGSGPECIEPLARGSIGSVSQTSHSAGQTV